MVVEPFAEDATEANHNPMGRVFYSASRCCVFRLRCRRKWVRRWERRRVRNGLATSIAGGFNKFKRATQTPFNLVFEARV